MAKYKESKNLCEVCGEPFDVLSDFKDAMADKTYSPKEYFEHQLNMDDEEKARREVFFTELFDQADARRAAKNVHS